MTETVEYGRSNEGNFLRGIKERLEAAGMFNSLRDDRLIETLEKEVPELIREFTGYLGGNEVPILTLPDHLEDMQTLNRRIQSLQDRLTYCYVMYLELYSKIKRGYDMLSAYIQVEVSEVSKLRSAEMRAAATSYILDDYSQALEVLDTLYGVIDQVRSNLTKVSFAISKQTELYFGKHRMVPGTQPNR